MQSHKSYCKHPFCYFPLYIFSGSRITRGLYNTKNIVINADVNGAYNILRKVDLNLFSKEDISKVQYIPKILNIS